MAKDDKGERVVVLTFNDIYDLDPSADGTRAGFAALGGLIAEERRRALEDLDDPAGAVIVCCCGDFMSAAPTLSGGAPDDAGRHMVPLLAAAGVTHVVPGNHEFDRGTRPCALRSSESSFRWLCTNVRAPPSPDGGSEGGPFGAGVDVDVVVTARGARIGLVGICTPRAPLLSAAGDGGAVFVDPIGAVGALMDPSGECHPASARGAEGFDALVALTHMDLADDVRLAMSCAQSVHLVVGGHDHEPIVHRVDGGPPPIVKCGCDARWLGRIVLRVDSRRDGVDQDAVVESIDMLPNDGTAVRDAQTERRIAALLGDLRSQSVPRVIGVGNDGDDPLGRDRDAVLCTLPHRLCSVGPREGPCPFADAVCDVLRDAADVDLFLIHAGLLRRARVYEAGHAFTAGDAHAELPFPSRCAVRLVTGQRVIDALEHGIGNIGQPGAAGSITRGSRALLHVSRPWRYAYDPTRREGERIVGVWCDGEPIVRDRIYRVGMPRYLSLGGDGFAALADLDQGPSPAAGALLCRLFVDGVAPRHIVGATTGPPRFAFAQ